MAQTTKTKSRDDSVTPSSVHFMTIIYKICSLRLTEAPQSLKKNAHVAKASFVLYSPGNQFNSPVDDVINEVRILTQPKLHF